MAQVIITLLGLAIGSFLGVVIFRGGALLDKKRSFCDRCQRKLCWWENIPLISYVMLKGRCRTCHSPIPCSYLLVELASGVFFLLTYLAREHSLVILFLDLAIVSFLVLMIFIDWQKRIIPDWITLSLLIITLFYRYFTFLSWSNFFSYVYAGLAAAFFLLLLHLLTKGQGMGLGDVKFALFMGIFLGFPQIILAFYLAVLTGGLTGVIMILSKKAKFGQQIAFGPFLALGFLICIWSGETIIDKIYLWLGL
ncbi:MAG: prepilin peptidase [Candidatus Shapirobacteria bacterium]